LALKPSLLTRLYRYVEKAAYLVPPGLFLRFIFLARRLPLRVAYGIASLVGDLLFLLWHRERANAIDNMCHVLGLQIWKVHRTAGDFHQAFESRTMRAESKFLSWDEYYQRAATASRWRGAW